MPIHAKTDPETIAEIRRRYLATDEHGAPLEKTETIAFEVGVAHGVLLKAIADLPRRAPHQEKQRLRIIELASSGAGVREIADSLGCPVRVVVRALRRAPEAPRQATPEQLEAERLAGNAARRERRKPAATTPAEIEPARLGRKGIVLDDPECEQARLSENAKRRRHGRSVRATPKVETPEEREARYLKTSAANRAQYLKQTPEQIERRRAQLRAAYARRQAAKAESKPTGPMGRPARVLEDPELERKRLERNAVQREGHARRRAAKSEAQP